MHPGTKQPVGPADLEPLFPREIIMQEVSQERYIEIPKEVREIYRQYRPSPLFRARRLEKALGTPAKIYYKYEGVSPTGSHKPNTAIAQAFYNYAEGIKKSQLKLAQVNGGSSLAYAGSIFGIHVEVYMVKVSYFQKTIQKNYDGNFWRALRCKSIN